MTKKKKAVRAKNSKKSAKKPIKKASKKASKKVISKTKSKGKPTKSAKKLTRVASRSSKVAVAKAKKTAKKSKSIAAKKLSMDQKTQRRLKPSDKATTLLGALEFSPYQPSVSETYMNDRQRDHFRKILDAWKQQLMQVVDLTVGHLKEEAVFYADPVDRAAQEEGFNLELRTRDRERRLIKKIEQSLDLLNNGEYGFCEDCGAEIGIRRLEARPTAVKCIDCKTFQEIREKQLGG